MWMSNLVLNGYGITLSRLTEDKIETVRKWRNSEKIRQFMVYQKEITQEQQKQWFENHVASVPKKPFFWAVPFSFLFLLDTDTASFTY